jgi:hypothetical protein
VNAILHISTLAKTLARFVVERENIAITKGYAIKKGGPKAAQNISHCLKIR